MKSLRNKKLTTNQKRVGRLDGSSNMELTLESSVKQTSFRVRRILQLMASSPLVSSRLGKERFVFFAASNCLLDWNPVTDNRLTVWEIAQHLIHTLENKGEDAAAALLARCGARGDVARELAYRLYLISERKGWTQEAFSYNGLVIAWPDLTTKMRQQREAPTDEQAALPFD